MACHCKYLIKIFNRCCFCVSLRTGSLLWGCAFLVWFFYMILMSGIMMSSIFPDEYQRDSEPSPSAMKTTFIFACLGFLSTGMVCIGVHTNNELMFVPFLVIMPFYILVHILAMIVYNFILTIMLLFFGTIIVLIYAWMVIWSYFTELHYAYEDEILPKMYST